MKILITYDVDKRKDEVKSALIELGFGQSWSKDTMTYFLPDNAVWHRDLENATTGREQFMELIRKLNVAQAEENIIDVKHLMAVVFTNWAGNRGEAHDEDSSD